MSFDDIFADKDRPAAPTLNGDGPRIIADPAAWVAAALEAEVQAVAEAPEGTRNARLNEAAFKVGTWEAGGLPVAVDVAWNRLAEAAEVAGLEAHEIGTTFRSGLRGGQRKPLEWTLGEVVAPAVPFATWGAPPAIPAQATPTHDQLVATEVARERARRAAKRTVDAEDAAAGFTEPTSKSLAALLAEPDEHEDDLIAEVLPRGSNATLAAPFKVGKTTLIANLLRALADGEPFLGKYDVAPQGTPVGRIALWDYEMSRKQLKKWLRDAGIRNLEAIEILNLRGERVPLTVPHVEAWAVDWHRRHHVGVWLLDPFARAAVGCGLDENDNSEVALFTDTIDVIKKRAGIHTFVMPVHTGRAELEEGRERARGATRLDDWPDVRWLLTQDEGRRAFRAHGRDVDEPQTTLDYDDPTRTYRATGVALRWEKSRNLEQRILDVVVADPGISVRGVLDALGDSTRNRDTLNRLVDAHVIRREDGPRSSHKHYANRTQVIAEGFNP